MKNTSKLTAVLLSLVLIISGIITPASVLSEAESSSSSNVLCGDVDFNGIVSSSDALLALQSSVNKITLTSDAAFIANVDSKGFVSASDALLILQYSVKKITSFPSEESALIGGSNYTGTTPFYITQTDEKELEGPITTFQESSTYNSALDIPTDSVMVYVSNYASADTRISSWEAANTGKTVNVMTAINRDNSNEYYTLHPERAGMDSQTRSDGTIVTHSVDGDYMVPTESYIEYKWYVVQKILEHNVGFIAFEEPEMWNVSGYSEGFKEEWVKYYGTAWEDQTASAEALYKTSKLKVYLFKHAIETLAQRIKEVKPDVKVVIASHSSINYVFNGIASNISTLASLDCVDGVIGQTWSDTSRAGIPYNGISKVDGFLETYLEYGVYSHGLRDDQMLFTLADPCADNASFTWDEHEYWYKKTIVSQLMQAEINRFQITVWPSRSFTPSPVNYKTMQLNVFAAQTELSGKATTTYAGTPGIYFAQSDSQAWQYNSAYMPTSTTSASVFGLTIPLIEKGIPLKSVNLEMVDSVEDLSNVRVLILSYDCMKPLNEKNNIAIAQWVKEGGILLYMGGHDAFENISTEWWSELNQTPLENLFKNLGLNNITVGSKPKEVTKFSYTGTNGYLNSASSMFLNNTFAKYCATFSGSGFNTFLKVGDDSVGIEAAVSQGKVICLGIPSSYYSQITGSANLMREVMQYALSDSSLQYKESNLMITKRGNVIAAETLSKQDVLTGDFIDLFDETLPVISSKTLTSGSSSLLYDISELKKAQTPVLAFTGGTINGDVVETASTTTFSLSSPSGAVIAARLLGNGKYFKSMTIERNGKTIFGIPMWDSATGSLLINFYGDLTAAEITVNWSDTDTGDTPTYEFSSIKVLTNSSNADAEYIYENTAPSNDAIRFCDGSSYVIYKFDMTKFLQGTISLDIFQNYVVEISDTPGNWTKVISYADTHPEHLTTGNNFIDLLINPTDYGYSGDVYIKLSNTDTTKGWGGSIRSFTINYINEVTK